MATVTRPRRQWAALAGVAFVAALVVAACGSSNRTPRIIYITPEPGPTGTPGAAGSLAPGVTPVTPADTTATITSVSITSTAPDGKWKVLFKKPVVGGIADSVAGQMNDAITQKVNAYISAFTGQDLPAVAAGAQPSSLEGDYSIAFNSPAILSLRFSVLTMVSGAAHPIGVPGSVNLVVGTGKTVALGDLFTDPAKAVAILAPKSHETLSTLLGTELTWDGKATSLDFFSKAWVFTAAGLEFSWPQGEMASMAAGRPTAVVSWADLKSVLKPGSPAAAFAK